MFCLDNLNNIGHHYHHHDSTGVLVNCGAGSLTTAASSTTATNELIEEAKNDVETDLSLLRRLQNQLSEQQLGETSNNIDDSIE